MKRLLIVCLLTGILCSLFVGVGFAVPGGETDFQDSKPETRAAASWDVDGDGVLEILAIGNSFSVDGLQYVWNIAKSMGISKIALGNLYIGGCSLATHYTNAKNDSAAYTYYFNDSGTWKSTDNYKISTAIASRTWDYVSLQQKSGDSGKESTYNNNLTNLISYVKTKLSANNNSNAKLIWHMTWAYQKDSTQSAFADYNKNQTTMYNAIVSAVQNTIATNSNFSIIIPSGTAVQNVRSSYTGDTLTRDGYHMSYGEGRYLLGLMWVKMITGLSVESCTYRPSDVSDQFRHVAIEAVNNAKSKPYAVTKSYFTGKDPVNKYVLLQPTLTKCAYWNSQNSNYNTLIKDASNSKNFYATVRFTKEELPVGSILVLSSGWKYRADAWVTDTKQSSRPDATTDAYTIVTEEWWGDYTIRAFNISKSTATDLSSTSAATIRNAFKIYVPEKTLEKDYVRIYPTITLLGYWNSTATAYNKINKTADNSKYFACTPRLTKTELPVGSVILVSNGWQYRPEGWVTDAKQSSRQDPVTTMSVYCTSSWWGDYTMRAFNVSKVETTDLTGKTESNIHSVLRIYVPKSKHTHTYDSGTITKEATCGAAGVKTFTCSLCRGTKTESIPALAHTEVIDAAVAATCTTAGRTQGSHCSVCGQTIIATVEIPAMGHAAVAIPGQVASCTSSGLTEGSVCSVCGDSLIPQETIPPTGHTEAVMEGSTPSCTVSGLSEGTYCTVCSGILVEQEVIPALGHTEVEDPAVSATCTENGLTAGKHCSVCQENLLLQEIIPAMGHATVKVDGLAPTCTEYGYTEQEYCSVCLEVFVAREEILPLGHTEITETEIPASCTVSGLTAGKHCDVCGAVLVSREEIAPTGHTYTFAFWDKQTHTCTCTVCGYAESEDHSFTDGLCICGEAEILEPIQDSNILIYHSLNLASDISVNYVVPSVLLNGYDMDTVYLLCTMPDYNYNQEIGEKTYRILPKLVGTNYYFTLEGLTAVHMTNRLSAVLYGNKGTQPCYSAMDSYSIADYAYAQLDKTTTSQTLKSLCAQLLRYGSAAQIYKFYHTDALADSKMTDAHRAYLQDLDQVSFGQCNSQGTELTSPKVQWVGKSLDLNTKVSLIYVVNVSSYNGDIRDLSLRLTYTNYAGEECVCTLTEMQPYGNSGLLYFFCMDNLLASELRTEITAQVFAGEEAVSVTIRYSPDTYGNGKTGDLEILCKALMAYSDCAKSYF